MKQKITLRTTQDTELHKAVKNGESVTVERYLLQGANANGRVTATTHLGEAASQGHLNIVKLLCESGADVMQGCYHERTALHLAILSGQTPVISYFLEYAKLKELPLANAVDKQKETPLHWAIQYAVKNKDEIISLLLKAGADTKLANEDGVTPQQLLEEKQSALSFK